MRRGILRYRNLVAAVKRAIDEADPIGLLDMGAPADEYALEVGTIVPRVAKAERPEEVADILHAEFVRWFDQNTAGPREIYDAPARRVWEAVLEFRKTASPR
jgi:hypothetical protein